MKSKRVRAAWTVITVFVMFGVSAVLGNLAAMQMAAQSLAKNSMLCQILFLACAVAGGSIVLEFRACERAGTMYG